MTPVITLNLVRKAAQACLRSTEVRKEADQVDTKKTIALMSVFEPLLGIKSEQELKDLSLAEVLKIAKRRVESGKVKLEKITPERLYSCIELSQARRNVAWKEVFLQELGEAKVQEVLQGTPETHSYKLLFPA